MIADVSKLDELWTLLGIFADFGLSDALLAFAYGAFPCVPVHWLALADGSVKPVPTLVLTGFAQVRLCGSS